MRIGSQQPSQSSTEFTQAYNDSRQNFNLNNSSSALQIELNTEQHHHLQSIAEQSPLEHTAEDDEMIENTFATEVNPLLTPPSTVNRSIMRISASNAPITPTALASSLNPVMTVVPRLRQSPALPVQLQLEESPGTPSFQVIYAIISKYFKSNAVSRTISNRLDTLSLNESISVGAIVKLATTKTRPNQQEMSVMIEELAQSEVLNINRTSSRTILITKFFN